MKEIEQKEGKLKIAILLYLIGVIAQTYHVDPNFAKAVAVIESRKGNELLRTGRLGKSNYYGPMGVNKCFLNRWPIDDPIVNIVIGVRALRGNERKVLHRYNAKCDSSYTQAIFQLKRQFAHEDKSIWGSMVGLPKVWREDAKRALQKADLVMRDLCARDE